VGPISVEVVGLPQVPSLLSLVWLTVVPPTLCTLLSVPHPVIPYPKPSDPLNTVSEVIALKLRRSNASNEYLYVQLFAGLSGIIASLCLLELWQVIRKRKRNVVEVTSVFAETQEEINRSEK
jgi:hypothetical protein